MTAHQDNRGRRGVFGHCAACGDVLDDVTALVCKECRKQWIHEPRFLEREAGHRARISDLFAGVHGPDSLEDVNRKYEQAQKKRIARETKVA